MTPKQKYDERKRLKIENDLRHEERRQKRHDEQDAVEAMIREVSTSLSRIANVLELWAGLQT